jgi:hypothetical protein
MILVDGCGYKHLAPDGAKSVDDIDALLLTLSELNPESIETYRRLESRQCLRALLGVVALAGAYAQLRSRRDGHAYAQEFARRLVVLGVVL